MSDEHLRQVMELMNGLDSRELYVVEKHAATLRRTRPLQIGKAYEVSEFPKGTLAAQAVMQIRIIEEDSNVLFAKEIHESGTLTCLIDDDDKRRALQALAGMGCLIVETNRW